MFTPVSLLAQAAPAANEYAVGTLEEGIGRIRGIWQEFVAGLPAAGVGLVVFILFVVVGRIVQLTLRKHSPLRRRHRNLLIAAGRLIYGGAIVLGILVAAVIVFPNFTPTGMLTSLGVGSLVLGLAFKDVLQNYLAGILLLVAEPFRSGDQVVFKEFEGTVEDVQPRATFIRTYDGRRVVIPNAELFTQSVTVNTAFDKRRVELDVGIGCGDDVELAKRLMLEAVAETGVAMDDPPAEALAVELASSSVIVRVRWWIQPPVVRESVDARDRILIAIKNKMVEHGIDLPFETQHVLFHDQTEETDGDRTKQREGWPAKPGEKYRPRRIADALAGLRARGGGELAAKENLKPPRDSPQRE